MRFEDLDSNLLNKIENCYIINGGESFLTTLALSKIEKSLNLNYLDFNKTIFFDNSTKTAKDIVLACEELPFCDSFRLIIVHDYLGKKSESEKKIFEEYLKKPNPSTCLVFFSSNFSEFFSLLEKCSNTQKIECDKLSFTAIKNISNELLKKTNLKFDNDALAKLFDYCNYSITKIATEIEKFKTIPIQNNIVKISDIEKYVTKDIEYVIFDLTNAIGSKQNERVFLLIDTMLKNKELPINIISTISNHFRRLFLVSRSNFSNIELSNLLNVKEFAIVKYKEQSKNFGQRKLKEIFEKCVEVEFMAKNGKMDPKNAINYLIANILT